MVAESTVLMKCLEQPINDLYEIGKDKFSEQLAPIMGARAIRKIAKHIDDVRKVKTIWQIDREVLLTDFYYPSKIIINQNKVIISAVNKLPDYEGIIIEGTAGQGKSILLRFLTYQELRSKKRIPIFIQFRHIESNETISDHIRKELDVWGISPTDSILDFLFESGKIILFLDGFDEISGSRVGRLIRELERLRIRYKKTTIIITSRPNSEIGKSAHFRINKLAELEEEDLPLILKKLVDDNAIRKNIINSLKESSQSLKELLKTPLIVTILVITYKQTQSIPDSYSDFYENLFYTLFLRHDSSKPGFTRERSTDISLKNFFDVFNALCFECKKTENVNFSFSEFHDLCETALKIMNVNCDSDNYIKDLTKITCLVIEEGNEYFFIHNSVMEYHCACFLKNRNNDAVEKFYAYFRKDPYLAINWSLVLNFLKNIDSYRYLTQFEIPLYENALDFLGKNKNEWNRLTYDEAKSMLMNSEFGKRKEDYDNNIDSSFFLKTATDGCKFIIFEHDPITRLSFKLFNQMKGFNIDSAKEYLESNKVMVLEKSEGFFISLYDLFSIDNLQDEAIEMLQDAMDEIMSRYIKDIELVKKEDEIKDTITF